MTAWQLAALLRDEIVAAYLAAGVDLPERRYVSPGLLPAWDCDQFTVSVERQFAHQGDVAVEVFQSVAPHPGFSMAGVIVALQIVRCVPTADDSGDPPTVDDMEAAAYTILGDQNLLHEAIVSSTLNGALAGCNGVTITSWDAAGPDGGFAGGTLRLRVSLV